MKRSLLLLFLSPSLLVVLPACDDGADDDTADDDDAGDDDDSLGTSCADLEADVGLAAVTSWPRITSCGNAYFGAANLEDTAHLHGYIEVVEPVVGATHSVVFDGSPGPEDQVAGRVVLDQGSDLSTTLCNDKDSPPGPVISRSWNAVSGTATLTVDSLDPQGFGEHYGTVEFVDVVVESEEDGTLCPIPDLTLTELFFGWDPI